VGLWVATGFIMWRRGRKPKRRIAAEAAA
jgi:hypothetical protein